jgi:N-acetylmuramoyl-L-alanine amidase CwlA
MGTKKSFPVVGYNWLWIGSEIEVIRPSMCLYHSGGKKHHALMQKSQVCIANMAERERASVEYNLKTS